MQWLLVSVWSQHPTFPRARSSERDAGSRLREFGGRGAEILTWAQTSDSWIVSTVVIAVAGAGALGESLPCASVCHLCKQGYSISLRNLCCVCEKTLDKTEEFCNFKTFKILECFDFCALDSICRGSSGLCSHMENGMH